MNFGRGISPFSPHLYGGGHIKRAGGLKRYVPGGLKYTYRGDLFVIPAQAGIHNV